jgi:hypothetical protein
MAIPFREPGEPCAVGRRPQRLGRERRISQPIRDVRGLIEAESIGDRAIGRSRLVPRDELPPPTGIESDLDDRTRHVPCGVARSREEIVGVMVQGVGLHET